MKTLLQTCLSYLLFSISFSIYSPSAYASSIASPDDLEGDWEGFVATPNYNELSVVRIHISFEKVAQTSGPTSMPSREEVKKMSPDDIKSLKLQKQSEAKAERYANRAKLVFNSIDDSGYVLNGDAAAEDFEQALSATVWVEPLAYLHPDFKETKRGGEFLAQLEKTRLELEAIASVPAVLHTQTGELRFGPKAVWDRNPRKRVVSPANLRLVMDPQGRTLFGELINPNTQIASKRKSELMKPSFLPALLWRKGQADQSILDSIGEELNLLQHWSVFRLDKEAQLEIVSESNAAPAPVAPVPSTRINPTVAPIEESEELAALRKAVAQAQEKLDELSQVREEARLDAIRLRKERRETEGEARDLATEKMKAAETLYNELGRELMDASTDLAAAKKAFKNAATEESSRSENVDTSESSVSVDLDANRRPEEDANEGPLSEYQIAVQQAEANLSEVKRAREAARQDSINFRKERRDAEGEAKDELTRKMKEAETTFNDLGRDLTAAYNQLKEAKTALEENDLRETESGESSAGLEDSADQRHTGRSSEPADPAPPSGPSRSQPIQKLGHDIETTPERMLAWVERLGEAVPELVAEGRIEFEDYWWPNVGQNLFRDEETMAAFGQALPEWSAKDRKMIVLAFTRSQQSGRARNDDVVQLPNQFSAGFVSGVKAELENYYPRTLARYYVLEHSLSYLDDLTQNLDTQATDQLSFLRFDAWSQLVARHFGYLWPSDYQKALASIKNQKKKSADAVLLARLDAAAETFRDRATAAGDLMDWWYKQNTLFTYTSKATNRIAREKLFSQIDAVLEKHLSPLVDELDDIGKGLDAVLVGGRLYAKATAIAGPSADHRIYERFQEKLNKRRDKDLERALPEIERRLADLNRLDQVDAFVEKLLSLPQDQRSEYAEPIRQAANDRRAEINVDRLLARFSPRERELMSKPGLLVVPDDYGPPTAQEIKFARMREAGRPNPSNNSTIIMHQPLLDMLEMEMIYEVVDVDIRAIAASDNAYWVAYTYRANYQPDGWAVENVQNGDNNILTGMFALMQLETVRTYDKFELTSSGWRSSTIRYEVDYGIFPGNANRIKKGEEDLPLLRREAFKDPANLEGYNKFIDIVTNLELTVYRGPAL